MSLEAIFISPSSGKPAKRALVALHGWGANAEDLASLASLFQLPDYQFIFPNAPFPHPQAIGGKAWYDLETSNYQGLSESREILLNWLKSLEDVTEVPLSSTILAGFSQGGAMTLDVGLSLPLAGLCCLSGYLHSQPKGNPIATPPVFIAHGKQDPVVPIQAAQATRNELLAMGVKVEYHEFEMGHEIQTPVLTLMQQFISDRESS